jgi:hypothetical protein
MTEDYIVLIFPLQIVYSFMKNNNTHHKVPTRQKSHLGRLDNPMSYRCEAIGQHFCKNLEVHIEEANTSILLNF